MSVSYTHLDVYKRQEYDNVEIKGLSLLNSKTIGQVAGEVSSGEKLYGMQSVNGTTRCV